MRGEGAWARGCGRMHRPMAPRVRVHAKAGGASEAVEAEPALWRGGHGVQQCCNQAALPPLHRVYLQVCQVEETRSGVARVKLAQHTAVRALLHHAQPDGHKRMGKLACEQGDVAGSKLEFVGLSGG